MKQFWRAFKNWLIRFAIKGIAKLDFNKAKKILLKELNKLDK